MKKLLKKLIKNESGATAIEYALIAALIAVAAILAMRTLGDAIRSKFATVTTELNTTTTG